jgi:hypothetical protein
MANHRQPNGAGRELVQPGSSQELWALGTHSRLQEQLQRRWPPVHLQADWQVAAGHVQLEEAGEFCKARVLVKQCGCEQSVQQLYM